MITNPAKLLALSEREFRREAGAAPVKGAEKKFKGMKLQLSKFDVDSDRRRGAAIRMTSVLLREDDVTLEHRVCENEKATKTYAEAAEWLQREARNLRKMAGLMDTVVGRLGLVLGRCGRAQPASMQA